jgi:phosphatidate cytidylyltransferase
VRVHNASPPPAPTGASPAMVSEAGSWLKASIDGFVSGHWPAWAAALKPLVSWLQVPPTVLAAFIGAYGLLCVATLIALALKVLKPAGNHRELLLRIRTWWVIVTLVTLALGIHVYVSIVCLALVSWVALREYLSLVELPGTHARLAKWMFLSIPIQYAFVASKWYGMFIVFIPVYWLLLLPLRMVLVGQTEQFLRAMGTLQWGVMTCVFSLSHMAFLLALPESGNPNGGGVALLFYLVFLTQFNDIMQYVWGKMLGKRKVTPTVSPNKTVEGLLGGVATTTLLAVLLAPYLTPIGLVQSVAVGVLIGLGGFVGDVTISAIKRDLGLKDSGTLLPGHGGILDRMDSLTFTAPVFFHFVYYLYYPTL